MILLFAYVNNLIHAWKLNTWILYYFFSFSLTLSLHYLSSSFAYIWYNDGIVKISIIIMLLKTSLIKNICFPFCFSMLFGNLFVYFAFKGEQQIEDHTRVIVYIVLSSVCALGVICMFFLRTFSIVQDERSVQG